ncbi:hypothetical protein ACJJTC_015291 [Scirpophaga incertulas]
MEQYESMKRKKLSRAIATDVLIDLVRQKECLWDRTNPGYRDKLEKEAAWAEIYRELEPGFDNMSEDMRNLLAAYITKKWYNVRDSYAKFLRGQDLRNKPYLYAKHLTFLEPIYFDKRADESKSEEKSDAEEQWFDKVFLVDGNETIEPEPEAKKRKGNDQTAQYRVERIEHNEGVVNLLTTLLNKYDDEDKAFFRSIMPTVKKLSDDNKFEFRINVMNMLQSFLKKENTSISFKRENSKSPCSDSD